MDARTFVRLPLVEAGHKSSSSVSHPSGSQTQKPCSGKKARQGACAMGLLFIIQWQGRKEEEEKTLKQPSRHRSPNSWSGAGQSTLILRGAPPPPPCQSLWSPCVFVLVSYLFKLFWGAFRCWSIGWDGKWLGREKRDGE